MRSVFLGTEEGWKQFAREIVVSVLIVASIGLLLFAISGVWPPMVAVESGSMEPHLSRGDLVFVMEEHRFSPEFAVEGTGVVTTRIGARHGYRRFGAPGDVIVYQPYGNEHRTPVIHRARFWVEQGENWYDTADPRYMSADSCEELAYCPAPYSGFITKGDNNGYYDQVRGISNPVKPEWIRGTAVFKIPWLGWVRLAVSEATVLPLRPVDITPIALDGGTPTGTGYQPQSGS
ncbi:MAG: S26 family signal peptidase [Halodesulfurarchaeum sp.]